MSDVNEEKLKKIKELRERAHWIAEGAERAPSNIARNAELAGARKLLTEADALEKGLGDL